MYGSADYFGIYIVSGLFGLAAYFFAMYALIRLAVAHAMQKRSREVQEGRAKAIAFNVERPLTGSDS